MKSPMNHQIISSSTLSGATVRTNSNENIGEIKDLMIDVNSGEISYAVLSVSTGFLNLDSKYFAVPLRAFTFDHFHDDYDSYLALDVSKERLENSPGFDKDNWPNHADSHFVDSVNTYYGISQNRNFSNQNNDGYNQGDLDNSRLQESGFENNRQDNLRHDSNRI